MTSLSLVKEHDLRNQIVKIDSAVFGLSSSLVWLSAVSSRPWRRVFPCTSACIFSVWGFRRPLGDILGIFREHLGDRFGTFGGSVGTFLALLGGPGRILRQVPSKSGEGISVSSLLGPKSGPKASPRGLERHQNWGQEASKKQRRGCSNAKPRKPQKWRPSQWKCLILRAWKGLKITKFWSKTGSNTRKTTCEVQALLRRGFGSHFRPKIAHYTVWTCCRVCIFGRGCPPTKILRNLELST